MSRKLSLALVLALTVFSSSAFATWGNVVAGIGAGLGAVIGATNPGYYRNGYYAYAGQACSPYPQGPHCAPGLVCVGNGSGYNWGFGVCQPAYGYNPGYGSGYNRPGWGGHNGGGWGGGHHGGGHCGGGRR